MIKISILDPQGNKLGTFENEAEKTFSHLARKHEVEIPFACWAGACWICACKVIQGKDFINPQLNGHDMMWLSGDTILTCISWVKKDVLNKDWEIILQRLV